MSSTRALNCFAAPVPSSSSVVLHRGAAASRVDEDRGLTRHRRHHSLGECNCVVVESGMDVEGPATCTPRVGNGEGGAGQRDQLGGVSVGFTLPCVHHAAGEEPHVSAGRPERRQASQREIGEPEPTRDDSQTLEAGEQRRPDEQGPVVTQDSESEALPPRRDPAARCQRCSGLLHQCAEMHPARARRLAPPALHAGLDEVDERVVDREACAVDRPHGIDAAAWRVLLLAGDPERRTVRQAQPAAHARRQQLGVETEHRQPGGRREGFHRRNRSRRVSVRF